MAIGGLEIGRASIPVMAIVGQMLLTALVLGTAAAVLGTGRVTVPLIVSTTLVWCWVPLVQLLTGLLLVRGATDRTSALTSYFATGRYWSLWILAFAAVIALTPAVWSVFFPAIATCIVPIVATARSLMAWRQRVFGETRGAARRRIYLHQAITHAVLLLYVAWAIALWPRLMPVVNR